MADTQQPAEQRDEQAQSLAGQWRFRLDPDDQGERDKWFAAELPDTIPLPGSTDEHGYGKKNTEPTIGRWTRAYEYVGPAWYQREVHIPDAWEGRRIVLFLERCHWESRLWVDERFVGSQNSLSTPHVYEIGPIEPGTHRLTLCVDNRIKIDIGEWTAGITDASQTNWNGIIGRIELRATGLLWVKRAEVHPDLTTKSARVRVFLGNQTGRDVQGELELEIRSRASAGKAQPCSAVAPFSITGPEADVETTVDLSPAFAPWDEFSPDLYDLGVTIVAKDVRREEASCQTSFGLRSFVADGRRFSLNGRTVFLRGNTDYCQNPWTGYPEMDIEGWRRIFRIAHDWGMNHFRFHSWCPPEAMFVAADEQGFMMQVELPHWTSSGDVSSDPALTAFLRVEADRIAETYGNHPSFCLMSMGNELGDGTDPFIHELVEHLQDKDPRHLYTCSSHPAGGADRPDDFFEAGRVDAGWTIGLARIGRDEPATDYDYRDIFATIDRPMITHELGHCSMFLDFGDLDKFKGPVAPRYLEVYRKDLESKGLLGQAHDFLRASGALCAVIYKEQIEAALRTPNEAGFALLGLTDYHGQGTAIVGVLDTFYDSKGLISAEDFRQCCAPTVPLLRVGKRILTTADTLEAVVEVAHYGPKDLDPVKVRWEVSDAAGLRLGKGVFARQPVPTGALSRVGTFSLPLSEVRAPQRLRVTVGLQGLPFRNNWDLWVYPVEADTALPSDVYVARGWDDACRGALAKGDKVLLIAAFAQGPHLIPEVFRPLIWSYRLFSFQPPTLGLLCEPSHPALADFPTDFHSDWQWQDLCNRSQAVDLSEAPADLRPIVQAIDTFEHNRKLGVVFEARVGPGRLLVSGFDVVDEHDRRPPARQLCHSLLGYMQSRRFRPEVELSVATLDAIFAPDEAAAEQGAPQNIESAVLHVDCGARTFVLISKDPWRQRSDRVIARREGFGYHVQGDVWNDTVFSLWQAPKVRVDIQCPAEFEGTLYARFLSPEGDRTAGLFFEGRDQGYVGPYDAQGRWFEVQVTQADAADGELVLEANAVAGPDVAITEVLLMSRGARRARQGPRDDGRESQS